MLQKHAERYRIPLRLGRETASWSGASTALKTASFLPRQRATDYRRYRGAEIRVLEFLSFSLETVAQELLGEGKSIDNRGIGWTKLTAVSPKINLRWHL